MWVLVINDGQSLAYANPVGDVMWAGGWPTVDDMGKSRVAAELSTCTGSYPHPRRGYPQSAEGSWVLGGAVCFGEGVADVDHVTAQVVV